MTKGLNRSGLGFQCDISFLQVKKRNFLAPLNSLSLKKRSNRQIYVTDKLISRILVVFRTGVLFGTPGTNRPFSYSKKESGPSNIFILIYTKGSIEWRCSCYRHCSHSKILQRYTNLVRLRFFFRIAKRSIGRIFVPSEVLMQKRFLEISSVGICRKNSETYDTLYCFKITYVKEFIAPSRE